MTTVLLIEDNTDIRENMGEILELAQYKVLLAENGKVGAAMALEHIPDIIVCDIMMPELDGYGVIHLLQKQEATRDIPFIFLTAKTERTEIRKGMELGADDYITKPFEGAELLNAIETRLSKISRLKAKGGSSAPSAQTATIQSAFEQMSQSNEYKKKQVIFSERNHAYRLHQVLKGKVKTYKLTEDGKELITGLYGPGDYFGYVALLEGSDYKENAACLEDAEIASIPKEVFEEITNQNPNELHAFIHLLAGEITEMEEQLLSLAYSSLRKKVATALLQIAEKYSVQHEGEGIRMSRENLAAIAGTAKESLIRTLSDFKDEGLIEINTNVIRILNQKKLAGMLN
ncbi:MAG: response regulator [Bacteroidetes bacterium]|nr:response regulator [Bacteroidota bacterium]